MLPWLIAIPLAYLAGAIPFGVLIARAKGVDITKHGSKNTGATNVGRVLGFRFFLLCFLLDMLKGLVPTLAAGLGAGVVGQRDIAQTDAWLWLAVMASAVLGHMFSPFLSFKGGKGVATGLGALLGVFPILTLAAAAAAIVWGLTFAIWRYVSLASIAAAIALPIATAAALFARLTSDAPLAALPFLSVTLALAALVVFRHRTNVGRLLRGEEHRIGAPRPTPEDSPSA
ncbi:MAG: glycerol-3-phosphate 1-O-acyltransferase PlsY [Phycisphaerales bacterium JB059]